ncbi:MULTISPECIES: glycoside hydrolase domain-containing protein [unclassified Leifsonia]|uniref:glycoside hydrolase domain-containing protein n=1 Tax=unclassified Leifsonia TaxID=2663824 RepID=UPI0008A73F88|nr:MULTISPECIES: glycoside hydrolase domain-containing protein [unclassified Leifsonia]SEI07510.1 Peptidoglycan-binding (PGRP) domain of peptidoglycan hydrolases-containing protein [Leifsonia sp. CL154]SFL80809.1 Peptidoglycan-binding (PGRP) domain of peptidoglycan hydrolases-containing protein [Leifsonia sp. CL147]
MVDIWVLNSQQWLNKTYGSNRGYSRIAEDGSPGWETMYGLTRALQIELGISATSDTFGPTTMSYLTSQFGTIGAGFTKNKKVVAILQCALWCKGYWGGAVVDVAGATIGAFTTEVAGSVAAIRADMGLSADPTVPPKLFKSLLNMDAYVTVNNGDSTFRAIQQTLNGRYWQRSDFSLMPCDGHFSRDVQQGLMYAIQYEIGMADGVANGNFGPGTQKGINDYGVFGSGASDGSRKLVSLFKAALCFNGYAPASGFNGTFDSSTTAAVNSFQSFAQLPATGAANFQTWASLLVSSGDPERLATASDSSTPLTAAKATTVFNSGYRIVGRYLNGSTKGIQPGELDVIFAAGLQVFPIYQEWNDLNEITNRDPDPGTQLGPYGFGVRQGKAAVLRARQLGFTAGTTVYFPVDADATADEIEAVVLPYFEGVRDGVATSQTVPFTVGSYGPRNVCLQVDKAGLAETAFVAGMSTGWSANRGFTLPSNWAYDQIKEYTIGSGAGAVTIDKNVASPRASPAKRSQVVPTPVSTVGGPPQHDTAFHWHLTSLGWQSEAGARRGALWPPGVFNEIVLFWLQERRYGNVVWMEYTPLIETVIASTGGGKNPAANEIAIARGAFNASQNNADAERARQTLIEAYEGDLPHLAASLRSYTSWGVPGVSREVQIGDLGGWALDLATAWADYLAARNRNAFSGTVADWMKSRIGSPSVPNDPLPNRFGYEDLVADVDAFLAAQMLKDDKDRPFSDAMREIRVQVVANPQWRFRAFLEQRFASSRDNVAAAVTHLFTSPYPTIAWPKAYFAGPEDATPGEVKQIGSCLADVLFGKAGL